MIRLRNKWKSRQGAAILLALLFLLICMMVTASLLMAAASNAGKSRSSRMEEQKYLTLSSALRLVCNELNGAQYCGQYTYQKEEHIYEVTDVDGAVIDTEIYYHHYYTQRPGTFSCGLEELSNLLPLAHDLDALFAQNFKLSPTGRDLCFCTPLPDALMSPRSPHTLTLTVDGGEDLSPGLSAPVTVTITLQSTGNLYLTARLDSGGIYEMEAVLTRSDAPEKLLKLIPNPPNEYNPTGPADQPLNTTEPITWTLTRITRKAATGP